MVKKNKNIVKEVENLFVVLNKTLKLLYLLIIDHIFHNLKENINQ